MLMPFDANEKVCNNRSGIYAIINLKTKKFYIGSAVKLRKRKSDHLYLLKSGKHTNKHLQRSYNKHGIDCFVFKVAEYVENKDALLQREQWWIDQFNFKKDLYNFCPIAGSWRGVKHNEKSKKKISIVTKNISEETRKKMSLAKQNMSDETKKRMSLAKQNINDETKKKISDSRIKKAVVQFNENHDIINIFPSTRSAAYQFGINSGNISACCNSKQKTSGGYYWMFEEDCLII